jgi:hypothetical protein
MLLGSPLWLLLLFLVVAVRVCVRAFVRWLVCPGNFIDGKSTVTADGELLEQPYSGVPGG